MLTEAIEKLNIEEVKRLKESPNSSHKDDLLSLMFGEAFDSIQIHAEEPMEIDWHPLLLKKALTLTHGRKPTSTTLTLLGDVTTTLGGTIPLRKLDQSQPIIAQITKPFKQLSESNLVTMTEDAAILMELGGIMLASAIRTSVFLPSQVLKDDHFVQHLLNTAPPGVSLPNVPGAIDSAHTLVQIAETNRLRELKLTNLFSIPSEVKKSMGPKEVAIFADFFQQQGRITETMHKYLGLETIVAFLLSAYNFHPTLMQEMLKTLVSHNQDDNKKVMLPSLLIEPNAYKQ